MTAGALLYGALLVAPLPAASEKLNAFTHVVFIPEDSDIGSVHLEKVKTVKVRATAADAKSCEDRAQGEHRAAAADCPQAESMTTAYEVTYSYTGQPMASDEFGNRHFTFQVYFRPDELPPSARKVLSTGKVKRAELAPYFVVKTDLDIPETVGEEIRPKAPSGYVAVKIAPTSSLPGSGPVSAEK